MPDDYDRYGGPKAGASADGQDGAGGDLSAAADDDPHPGHRIYPYLLRNMTIDRADHVWCADITYIAMRRGFLYLVGSWTGRRVMFCPGGCRTPWMSSFALRRWKKPWHGSADPGFQLRPRQSVHLPRFTGVLQAAGVRISMDGRGRWMDNVFIERLWRSLKYESHLLG